MNLSVFDLFKIGIGPSSSHTVGPMKAARLFALRLRDNGLLAQTSRIQSVLYGSLGATGKGHGSDTAVLLGLEGHEPDQLDPDSIPDRLQTIRTSGQIHLLGQQAIPFREKQDVQFVRRTLPYHPNGLTFTAFDGAGGELISRTYYSVGGGFVVDESATGEARIKEDDTAVAYPFETGQELLELCQANQMRISDLMLANELAWRSETEIREGLWHIWEVMQACVRRGCATEGILPGGMKVKRRAPSVYERLRSSPEAALRDPLNILDWVNLYALAVNEENAAGGRVVTAPTNGAAGIIPAVLHYWIRFVLAQGVENRAAEQEAVTRFLLTGGGFGLF